MTREGVEHYSAVHLAPPCPMFDDVGDSQLVRVVALELVINEIACSGKVGCPPPPGPPEIPRRLARHINRWTASSPTAMPWPIVSSAWTRRYPHTPRESAYTCSMHIGEPCVSNRPLQRRAAPPGVEARHRRRQHPAGHLDGKPLHSHCRNGCEPAPGSARSLSNSVARP